MSLRNMMRAAANEPPPEYVGKRQRREPAMNDAPQPPAEYRPSNPPVNRMSQAAAAAAQHVYDLEQQLKDQADEIATRKANEQFLSLQVAELKLECERLKLENEAKATELGEMRGKLSAAAGVLIDVLSPFATPKTETQEVASAIGESAVADALKD